MLSSAAWRRSDFGHGELPVADVSDGSIPAAERSRWRRDALYIQQDGVRARCRLAPGSAAPGPLMTLTFINRCLRRARNPAKRPDEEAPGGRVRHAAPARHSKDVDSSLPKRTSGNLKPVQWRPWPPPVLLVMPGPRPRAVGPLHPLTRKGCSQFRQIELLHLQKGLRHSRDLLPRSLAHHFLHVLRHNLPR